jgi:hypothetical protein
VVLPSVRRVQRRREGKPSCVPLVRRPQSVERKTMKPMMNEDNKSSLVCIGCGKTHSDLRTALRVNFTCSNIVVTNRTVCNGTYKECISAYAQAKLVEDTQRGVACLAKNAGKHAMAECDCPPHVNVGVGERVGWLTVKEIEVACRNIGFDLTCGSCASLFYTGSSTYRHDTTCTTTLSKTEP